MSNTRNNLTIDSLRLDILLKNVATNVLRDVFKRRYARIKSEQWEDGGGRFKNFLIGGGMKQWMGLQKERILKADLKLMDLAQLGQLLLRFNWTSLASLEKLTDEEKLSFENENKLIQEIVNVRNKHFHSPGITETNYIGENNIDEFWEISKRVLMKLGGNELEKEIDATRNSDLAGVTYTYSILIYENMAKSKSLRREAKDFVNNKMYDNARKCYTRALEFEGLSHVECGKLYSNRCYASLKLSEEAYKKESDILILDALEDARITIAEHRPDWWEGYYRLAQVYKVMKELQPAIISCEHALKFLSKRDDYDKVHSLRCEIFLLAEELGMELNFPYDRPTSPFIVRKAKAYASEFGITLPDTTSLPEIVEALIYSGNGQAKGVGYVLKGHCYTYGLDEYQLMQNTVTGAECYRKAGCQNNLFGFYYCGLAHLNGKGVTKNPFLAKAFLEVAATSPEIAPNAMCALGKFYEVTQGSDFPQDLTAASLWYSRASEAGSGEASYLLSNFYRKGLGVSQSDKEASSYMTMAAEQGYPMAMERLAMEFLTQGDLELANSWYSKAISAGCLAAFLNKHKFQESFPRSEKKSQDVDNKI